MEALVSRLEVVTQKLEQIAQGGTQPGGDGGSQPFVSAYNEITNGALSRFLTNSKKIGGEVAAQAELVKVAFKHQNDFLSTASKCKKPSDAILSNLVKPLSQDIANIQSFKENNRKSPFINHLSAIAESIPALGWVLVSPTPAPHVKEMSDSGQFYSNRVLKDFKEKGAMHADWVKSWMEVLTELASYIKQYHTTGVSWNSKGCDASSCSASSGVAPPRAGPPPPGPPPPPADSIPFDAKGGDDAKAQLFADLNKGEGITKSLKKVTDDMKTHKNPALRFNAPQPFKSKPKPEVPAKNVKTPNKKPPKLQLDGKKWIVENFSGDQSINVADTQMKQTVYIYNCEKSTVAVKGKINAITMDNCKKTALVFDECISSLDFVNCQSVKAQVTGKVPIINIDKTDGCMIYLSKDSLSAQIVSAKSSEMNVMLPDDQNEYKELPLPEQFRTYWDGSKLVTEVTDVNLG